MTRKYARNYRECKEDKRSLQKKYITPKKSSINECENYRSLETKTRKQQNEFVGGSIGRKASGDTPLVYGSCVDNVGKLYKRQC
ncbi:hypothetical protein AVEN_162134-1 [Araneus ventricosus]|uniref:Uncharacterized protein n=1 Tax=Araneus ventricosus TaxID=182803 RepID=A0A4Y2NVF9_ARAVE|nr:hypothetical protein AVEN_162134-1 [Araneus ventricosus]